MPAPNPAGPFYAAVGEFLGRVAAAMPPDFRANVARDLVRANAECTVYLFGGPEGRARVDHLWDQRARDAEARRRG